MNRNKIKNFIINLFLGIFTALLIYPFLMMIMGSFKTGTELSANPAGIPRNPVIDNYIILATYNGGLMIRTFINSVFITLTYIVLTITVTSLAAFGFSKYRFKGRDMFFLLLLATMMVPRDILIPPLFILFRIVGLLDTYSVQILPEIANVFGLFMLRQFMLSMPDSVIESARIDGAGHFKTFFKVVFPMSAPALGALAILLFTHKWNDFLWPVLMVNTVSKLPISVILPNITNESGDVQAVPWELILTGCTVVTIPVIIVFFSMQDKVISSMTVGAVKE